MPTNLQDNSQGNIYDQFNNTISNTKLFGQYVWRPVLVKIVIIKLPTSQFFQPLLYVLLACCVFLSAVQFFLRWLLIIFSNVNYFN